MAGYTAVIFFSMANGSHTEKGGPRKAQFPAEKSRWLKHQSGEAIRNAWRRLRSLGLSNDEAGVTLGGHATKAEQRPKH